MSRCGCLIPIHSLPARSHAEHMFFATAERIAAVRRMIAAEELMEEVGAAATVAAWHVCCSLAWVLPLPLLVGCTPAAAAQQGLPW